MTARLQTIRTVPRLSGSAAWRCPPHPEAGTSRQSTILSTTPLPTSFAPIAGYGGNDDADLINMISSIDGNTVGMVFVEQGSNHVKISWRALEAGVDVSKVAKHFNGGGHAAAAGADIAGSLSEVQQEVLKTTREMLNL